MSFAGSVATRRPVGTTIISTRHRCAAIRYHYNTNKYNDAVSLKQEQHKYMLLEKFAALYPITVFVHILELSFAFPGEVDGSLLDQELASFIVILK